MARQVKVSTLVLDFTVYPRHRLDDVNLRTIRESVAAGETLPPVIADTKTKRVADGFHRVTELLRRDPDANIAVEFIDYDDDKALFLDAVRRNARHGARLSPYDRARCLELANVLTIDPTAIAGALAVSVDVTAKIRAARTAFDPNGAPLQLKRPFRHRAGQTLNETEMHANEKSSGWTARFHADQIVMLLGADAVDLSDDATIDSLRKCGEMIAQALAASAI